MQPERKVRSALAAIRVSTTKQGTDGDSPEAQKELIDQFARTQGYAIVAYKTMLESASGDTQPMQQVIDFCKDPKNKIDMVIIKSIDRFTRGGSTPYDLLKAQLSALNIDLVDAYGIISTQRINTLGHLNQEYKWSTFSPSRKAEMLEAERSKDEVRDILSRVIGAEIRYTQMGYWMRKAPHGYVGEKVETHHGKRVILKPHPAESRHILKLFEMRASGRYTDIEIAEKLNTLGYRGRTRATRAKDGSHRIIKKSEGSLMNHRQVWRLARNPIYAGVNIEKWTNGQPVKCMFDGLVSIKLFNAANKGKRTIIELPDHKIAVEDHKDPIHATPKGTRAPDFPFKRFVMCPQCDKPLLGSSSRGKSGAYFSYYHCDKRGHKFRVTKSDLENHVSQFVSSLTFSQEHVNNLFGEVERSYETHVAAYSAKVGRMDAEIHQLNNEAREKAESFSSIAPSARGYINEQLEEIDVKIKQLSLKKIELESKKPINIKAVIARVKYFVEHLDELVLQQIDPIKKAQFFGLLFDQVPTYEEIKGRTPQNMRLHPIFEAIKNPSAKDESLMVISRGIEPLLPG